MEHSPDNQPAQGKEKGSSLPLWGLALLAVLIVGVAFGYFISQAQDTPVQVVVTATPEPRQEIVAQAEELPATTASATDNGNTPPTPTIMDFVLSDARHFQGSDEAPITMIEFSDFK